MLGHGLHESRREPPSFRVRSASLRGDRKPRRNRQAEAGHLSQSRSLATEQILHLPRPLGEAIDQLAPTHHRMRPFTRFLRTRSVRSPNVCESPPHHLDFVALFVIVAHNGTDTIRSYAESRGIILGTS